MTFSRKYIYFFLLVGELGLLRLNSRIRATRTPAQTNKYVLLFTHSYKKSVSINKLMLDVLYKTILTKK